MKIKTILFLLIIICLSMPLVSSATLHKYEWYEGSNDDEGDPQSGKRYGQMFRIGTTGSNVSLAPTRASVVIKSVLGATRTWYINVTGVAGNVPNYTDQKCYGSIATASLNDSEAWNNITLSSCPALDPGGTYALIYSCPTCDGSNRAILRQDTSSPSYPIDGRCVDTGAGWTCYSTAEINFQVWSETASTIIQTINEPANDATQRSPMVFNVSTNSSGSNLTNMTLLVNNVGNGTVNLTGTYDSGWFNRSFGYGDFMWNVTTCLLDNTCEVSATRNFTITRYDTLNLNWSNTTTEGTTESFEFDIISDYAITDANLVYNGTEYSASISTSGNIYNMTASLTVPNVVASIDAQFYWNVTLADGYNFITDTFNQTISNLAIDNCSSYSVLLINMTWRDEGNQSILGNATHYNSSIKADIDIYAIGASTPIIEFYQEWEDNYNPQICLEGAVGSTVYRLDALITYDGDTYAFEHYNIQNYSLTNATTLQNIHLYDLKDSNSQEFKITFKDDSFIAVSDALIEIQRKYVEEGVFKTVEIPKTDNKGETIVHLDLSDIIYTFIVSKNGEVLGTFSNLRPFCQNPTITDCEINLNSFVTSIDIEDFTVGDDFTFTLTYNKTSQTVQTVYSIPSGAVSTVLLNVTLLDGTGTTLVCNDSLISASGTLSCVVPGSYTNATIIAEVYKDGELQGQAFIDTRVPPSDIYGYALVFVGLILFLTLLGIGISDSPMVTAFVIILGAGSLILLNLVDTGVSSFVGGGATFLWLVIAIALLLIKASRRE